MTKLQTVTSGPVKLPVRVKFKVKQIVFLPRDLARAERLDSPATFYEVLAVKSDQQKLLLTDLNWYAFDEVELGE